MEWHIKIITHLPFTIWSHFSESDLMYLTPKLIHKLLQHSLCETQQVTNSVHTLFGAAQMDL